MNGKKKMVVLGQTVVHEGVSKKNGRPFSIYEYTCADENGKAIDLPNGQKFKGFDRVPEGELIEFDVEKNEREHNGKIYVDWTIKPPRGKSVREPSGLELLVNRIEKLELEVQELRGGSGATTPVSDVPAPAVNVAAPASANDDIPFLWRPVDDYTEAKGHASRW